MEKRFVEGKVPIFVIADLSEGIAKIAMPIGNSCRNRQCFSCRQGWASSDFPVLGQGLAPRLLTPIVSDGLRVIAKLAILMASIVRLVLHRLTTGLTYTGMFLFVKLLKNRYFSPLLKLSGLMKFERPAVLECFLAL